MLLVERLHLGQCFFKLARFFPANPAELRAQVAGDFILKLPPSGGGLDVLLLDGSWRIHARTPFPLTPSLPIRWHEKRSRSQINTSASTKRHRLSPIRK